MNDARRIHRTGRVCYAYQEASGTIDLESIAESPAAVRLKMLEQSMGWRFKYPDTHDESWERLLKHGSVVAVSISVDANR